MKETRVSEAHWVRSADLCEATNRLLYPLQEQLPAVDGVALPETVFHYTNVHGLLGIVESGVLWATDYQFMNDSEEIRYVFRLAAGIAGDLLRAGGGHGGAIAQTFLNTAITAAHPYADEPYYLLCFSEVENSLSQWRAYGGAAGFCLGLPGDIARPDMVAVPPRQGQSSAISLIQVIYDRAAHIDYATKLLLLLLEVCRSPVLNGYPSPDLAVAGFIPFYWGQLERVAYRFKHPDFADEREWRLVTWGAASPARFRAGPLLTPYIEVELDSATRPRPGRGTVPLRSVRHGPTQFPGEAMNALSRLLDSRGYALTYCSRLGSTTPARLP
jgi:hypothetical protein